LSPSKFSADLDEEAITIEAIEFVMLASTGLGKIREELILRVPYSDSYVIRSIPY